MTPLLCRNREDEIGAGREMSGGVGRLGELGGGEEQPGVLFIGAGRRWSAVEAGRRARRPLMALGLVVASRSGGAIRGGVQDDETAQAVASGAASIPGAWSGELEAGSVMHGAVCGDATRAAGCRGRAVLRVVASDGAGWWAARCGAGCSVRSYRGTGVSRVQRGCSGRVRGEAWRASCRGVVAAVSCPSMVALAWVTCLADELVRVHAGVRCLTCLCLACTCVYAYVLVG